MSGLQGLVITWRKFVSWECLLATSVYILGCLDLSILWVLLIFSSFTVVSWDLEVGRRRRRRRKMRRENQILKEAKCFQDSPRFATSEKCEGFRWIHVLLEQFWPRLQYEVNRWGKNEIEQNIRKTLELYSSQLNSFRLERIDLGDSIPRIINLRVCPSTCTQEIVLDIQFNYTGDFFLGFRLMKVWGGLDDLEVKGTIRIHVFISGKGEFFDYIQFGFLETPVLKFDLEGGANILDFPLLRTHIRDGLDDILETNLVSPNLLTINIRDRTDNSLYPNRIPAGVVRVDQIRGLNLPYKDLGFLGSRVDPYCTVSIGSDLKKTRILKDEPNPIWSETFWFPLRNPTGLKLKIQLIDWDRGSQDDEIKDLEVDLSPIIKSQRTFTFPLNQDKRKRSERGELLLRASWFSLLPLEQYISSKSGPTVISLSVGNLSLQYPSAQEWVKLYIETRLGRISSGWFLIPDQEKMVAKSCLLALDRGFQDDDITLSIRTWSNEVLLEHVLSPNLLDNSRRTIIAGGARKRLCLEYQGILFLARHGERQGFNLLEDSESEPPEFGTHNSRNKIRCQEQIYLDETLNPEKLNLGCQDLGSETWRHIDSGEPSLEPCHL